MYIYFRARGIDLVSFSIDNKCGNVWGGLGKLISKFNLLIYIYILIDAFKNANISYIDIPS